MANSPSSKSTILDASTGPEAAPSSPQSQQKPFSWYEQLYTEQKTACEFLLRRLTVCGGAALLSEQGTGKTLIALAAMEKLEAKTVLIVCPKTAIHVTWKKRTSQATVVSYDNFRNHVAHYAKVDWDLVIFDESQYLKDRGSAQSRAARKLRGARRRLILSGTPIDACPSDLWAQMRFVDAGCLGDRWADFDREYLYPSGYMGYERTFRKSRLPKFLKQIEPYCYRLESKLEQPRLIHVPVELGPHQRAVYDEMAHDQLVTVGGHIFAADTAAVRDIKLFQIVGGFIHDDGTVVRVGDAKLNELHRLMPKLQKPVIFCRFLAEMRVVELALKEHFPRVAHINGEVKDTGTQLRRTRILEDFQAGLLDALVVQTRTGGVSVEFSTSHECVFYSMGYSYIDFQQIIARFRRIGQTKRVLVYLMTAQGTVDEEPYLRVTSKAKAVKEVVDHIQEKSK